MSLRKKAQLTKKKIKANRRNGRKANGPIPQSGSKPQPAAPAAERTEAGELDLQAMVRSLGGICQDPFCPEPIRAAISAMDEDPAEFSLLHRELTSEWEPSTPTLRKLVLRLAYLMWRQERAQRAQDGLMLCRMEKELGERTQRMLDAVSAPAEWVAPDAKEAAGLRQAAPSEVKFQQLLDWLQFLINLLNAGDFSDSWELTLKQIYGTKLTWRADAIIRWARQLADYFAHAREGQAGAPPPPGTAEAGNDLQPGTTRRTGVSPLEAHGQDDQATLGGTGVSPVEAHGQDGQATLGGTGVSPVEAHGQDGRATPGGTGVSPGEGEATQEDEEEENGEDSEGASAQDDDAEEGGEEEEEDAPKGCEPPLRPIRTAAMKDEVLRKLRRELGAEHTAVAMEYKLYKALNIDFPWHLRSSLFAPQDKYWGTAIWQEQSLGQQIESTLRMIVTLKAREGSDGNRTGRASRRQKRARSL